jgi:hypothetical protein
VDDLAVADAQDEHAGELERLAGGSQDTRDDLLDDEHLAPLQPTRHAG